MSSSYQRSGSATLAILVGLLLYIVTLAVSVYMTYHILGEDWGQYLKLVGAGVLAALGFGVARGMISAGLDN